MHKKGRAVLVGAEDEENLAIRYLGAVLIEKEHKVKIIPCSKYDDISATIKEIKSFNPHLVGISMAFQSLAPIYLELIHQIKKRIPDVHITVGGHFPTFEYNKLMEYNIDSVIRFEGEIAICQLMDVVVNDNDSVNDSQPELRYVPNLIYRDPHTNDIIQNSSSSQFPSLNKIPFPLRNKRPHLRLGEKFATLVGSRGCFHSHCIYCCIGAFHQEKIGPKYALRSPENVAEEMQHLYHNQGVRLFQFHDDNFLLPHPESSLRRLNDLKDYLTDRNVNLEKIGILVKLRADNLSEELIHTLNNLGTIGIFLGVENASDHGLKSLGRGSTKKDINNALKLLEKYDIAITFNLLMFHPRANLSEINENIFFMQENLDKAYDFGRAEIVAGSPLETLTRRKKLIHGTWPLWDYHIEDESVEKMFRLNSLTFYHPKSIYSEISHQIIALSYRSKLIKRFYPGKESVKLDSDVSNLIQSFNQFNLDRLLEIYQLTAEVEWEDELNELNHHLNQKYPYFSQKTRKIVNRMDKLQLLEKQFQNQGLENFLQNSSFWKKIFRI